MITKEHIDYLSKADNTLKKIIENNTTPKISKLNNQNTLKKVVGHFIHQ